MNLQNYLNTISENNVTIANNTPKVFKAGQLSVLEQPSILKGSSIGSYVRADNVSLIEHELSINLSGNTLTDFSNVTLSKYGKNIINMAKTQTSGTTTKSGITYTIDTKNGKVTLDSGTASAGVTIFVYGDSSKMLNLVAGEDMVLSGCINGTNTTYRLMACIERADGTTGYPQDYGSGLKITKGQKIKYVYINVLSGYSVPESGPIEFYPQLEVGISKSSFEPYKDEEIIKVNGYGDIHGVMSVSPTTTLLSSHPNDISIIMQYYKDADAAFEDQLLNIAMSGGI